MFSSTKKMLLLALFIGLISAQNMCSNYTNEDSSCADKCISPAITDEKNKLCLSVSNCTTFVDLMRL